MNKQQLYKMYYNMLLMMSMKTVGFASDAAKSADQQYVELLAQDMNEMAQLIEHIKDELIKLYDGDVETYLKDMEKHIQSDPFYQITKDQSTEGYNPRFDMSKLDIN